MYEGLNGEWMNEFAQVDKARKQLQTKQNLGLQTPNPGSSLLSHVLFSNGNISQNHRSSDMDLETPLTNNPIVQMRKQRHKKVPLLGWNQTSGRWVTWASGGFPEPKISVTATAPWQKPAENVPSLRVPAQAYEWQSVCLVHPNHCLCTHYCSACEATWERASEAGIYSARFSALPVALSPHQASLSWNRPLCA